MTGPLVAPTAVPEIQARRRSDTPDPTTGSPLEPVTRSRLETSFHADLGAVRVHDDARAADLARSVSARAVTVGSDIFLGAGERATDVPLMAHEVAHVLQQDGAPAVQPFRAAATDRYELEAHEAAASVGRGETATVEPGRAGRRVQRLGISDALDYFADKANIIPGFRMFTIIIGINPINMSRVERSAANILRALIEFMPGGGLITQALDNSGVFERAGAFVEEQVRGVGLSGASIRRSINQFLDSLGWRDIFHLGDVWNRAKRIFTDPIDRLFALARNVVSGIVRLVKDAILRPLARLAEGTRGYDLLKAVLGRDPITGDAVPRTAETLIGGFMKLIGQEEVWLNIQRARAIPRAWAWFQGALTGLLGFVRQIPTVFLDALRALELADIILVPRAFGKLARVFGGFIGNFLGWAGRQVLSLLQIIFEVLAPAVMPYLRKAMGAFNEIIRNPVRFIGNLVRAGVQGFRQFMGNFLNHLRRSLIDWLTGTMAGAGIYIPQAFELREIVKFVLSVLGLTWANLRGKIVRVIGDRAMAALESGFDLIVTLVREGPAAAWERIRESISNLREMVMEQIMAFVRERIVTAAITRLLTSLNPAGAFIQAILAIYNTVMFVVERLRQIAQVAASFIDSIAAIASGAVGAAAARVETTLAGFLTLVISFLARLVGLGRVSDAVQGIVNRIRAPIDRALDRVVEWIVGAARRVGRLFAGGGSGAAAAAPGAGAPGAPAPGESPLRAAVLGMLTERLAEPHDRPAVQQAIADTLTRFRGQGLRRLEIGGVGDDGRYQILAEMSPFTPLLEMETFPERASVRLAADVRFTQPITLAPRAFVRPSLTTGQRVSGQGFETGHLVHPDANPESGTQPVTSDALRVAAWNRGIGEPNRVSNASHAERQFLNWLRTEVGPNRSRLQAITIDISHSPCELCTEDLRGLIAEYGSRAQIQIRYDARYFGSNKPLSTTKEDIAKLSGHISGRQEIELTNAQRDLMRQRRWGKGERIGGRTR